MNKIDTQEEIGRKGGKARAQKYSQEELSHIEKCHPGFYTEIGSKGGKVKFSRMQQNIIKN